MTVPALAAVLAVALAVQEPAPVQAPAAEASRERKLSLTFDSQGHVTLVAQNVTVAEILAEWGRKGGTQIQGAERLAGGPIQLPLQFDNQPELEVVEALLRQAAGVSVAPRRVGTVGASQFEAIYILATSTATAAPSYGSTPMPQAPQLIRGFPDDEIPPVVAPGVANAPAAAQPAPRPAGPSGVIVPVVPVVPVGGSTTGRGGGGGEVKTPPPGGRGGGGGGR